MIQRNLIILLISLLSLYCERNQNRSSIVPLTSEQKKIAKSRVRNLNENSKVTFKKDVGNGVFTELFRFDIGEAEDSVYFGSVTAVTGFQGKIFILDAWSRQVVVFDYNGKFQKYFGKKGQGPGEMLGSTGIATSKQV